MFSFEEELLEPIARFFRFQNAFKKISKSHPISILDLGCGPQIRAYYAMNKYGINISQYIGIDPLISKKILIKHKSEIKTILIADSFERHIPVKDESVDYLISLAVLEHIDYPKLILNDIPRVLKKGGKAILTTPSPKAKSILEFMSYKLGLISPREIKEHKNYFTKEILYSLIKSSDEISILHRYFEFGLNNILIISKNI